MEPHRKMAAWATCVLASAWACTDARAPEPATASPVEVAAEAEQARFATATTPSPEAAYEELADLLDAPRGSAYGAAPAMDHGGGGEGRAEDILAGLQPSRSARPANRRVASNEAPSMASRSAPLAV